MSDEPASTGSEAADTAAASDAGPPGDDLAVLAELQASGEGGEDQPPADPAQGDQPADGDKPAEEKPSEEAPKEPAKDAAAEAERRARKILASANRRLAAAQHTSRNGVDAIRRGLKTKPLETLRELGTSIKEILDAGDAEGEPKAPTAEDRIAALEARLQEQLDTSETARIDREIDARKAEIKADIKAAAKDFPLIARGDAGELVIDTMLEYHRLYKRPCSVAEAAKTVEDYLVKLSGAPAPSAAPASNGQKPAPQSVGKTLGGTATRNVAPDGDDWPDDPDARHELAAKELGLNLHPSN